MCDALATYSTDVLHSTVTQRVIFAESAAAGKAVFELDPHSRAAKEISALVDEILELPS